MGACTLATLGLRVPFVYRNIGDPDYWANNARRYLQVRICLRRAASVVVMWPEAASTIARRFGLPRARLHVVSNGVSGERFPLVDEQARAAARLSLGVPQHAKVVAYVGALSPEKRVGDAIDTVAGLPAAHLVIAGAGPQGDDLATRAERDAPGRTHFLGMVKDTRLVYRAADVVVLPSVTEGIPATLIEAGLSGLPVVATDVGGIRQIVVPGETGFLVTPGDVEGLRQRSTRRSGPHTSVTRRGHTASSASTSASSPTAGPTSSARWSPEMAPKGGKTYRTVVMDRHGAVAEAIARLLSEAFDLPATHGTPDGDLSHVGDCGVAVLACRTADESRAGQIGQLPRIAPHIRLLLLAADAAGCSTR